MPLLFFVAIITDDNIGDLDKVVQDFQKEFSLGNSIQAIRNFAGGLAERLSKRYPKTEGIAVIVCADKMIVSSLAGDFMNHLQCRLELYQLLNLATNI